MKPFPDLIRDCRKRLVQMHFESGVGHIGGNLSATPEEAIQNAEYYLRRDPNWKIVATEAEQ